MNKFNKAFALLFVAAFVGCMFIEMAEAGRKKRQKIKAALKGLLLLKLKNKKKIIPLPM